MAALSGLKVIDLTSVLMGPYATQSLGDFGADVIKVEAPAGDLIRAIGPSRSPGMGPLFLNVNRSKRSIIIDLKTVEGREVLLELCRGADVLVYNVRPAAMARLGLSYEHVSAVNPRIIYAGLYGYGQQGRYASRPAYDDLIQGGALLPYLFMISGSQEPRYVPSAVADRVVGLTALGGILAAVIERTSSGRGQRVDVPMFETMVSFMLGDHLGGLTFEPPLDAGGYGRQLAPDRRPYRTADGHVCALVYTDEQWRRFLAAIEQPDLMQQDDRFASFAARMEHLAYIYGWLAEIFLTRSAKAWVDLLEAADVPVMVMHTFETVLDDPHLADVDFFQCVTHPSEGEIISMANPVCLSETALAPKRLAPQPGQHTIEVLRELGADEARIAALIQSGVVTSFGASAIAGKQ